MTARVCQSACSDGDLALRGGGRIACRPAPATSLNAPLPAPECDGVTPALTSRPEVWGALMNELHKSEEPTRSGSAALFRAVRVWL